MSILSFVGQIFKPAADLIDSLHTSDDERLQAKSTMLQMQAAFLVEALGYEKAQLEAQAGIVRAEAQSTHWLTANWRPITMLSFVAATLAYWFGLTPDLPPESVEAMFTLVQIGVGGYVVGRSVEKVVPPAIRAFKEKEKA